MLARKKGGPDKGYRIVMEQLGGATVGEHGRGIMAKEEITFFERGGLELTKNAGGADVRKRGSFRKRNFIPTFRPPGLKRPADCAKGKSCRGTQEGRDPSSE